MPNVQLTAKESVKVFVEEGTGRILGFAPEFAKLLGRPVGIRYREHVCLHVREIETWVAKYRIQQEVDAEEATLRQIEREAPFRKKLRDAIRMRNQHVNRFNRDLNEAFIKLMERRYDQIMEAKKRPQLNTMAEASEVRLGDNEIIDFATASPVYKNPGDMRATGAAVEFKQIERDRRA